MLSLVQHTLIINYFAFGLRFDNFHFNKLKTFHFFMLLKIRQVAVGNNINDFFLFVLLHTCKHTRLENKQQKKN